MLTDLLKRLRRRSDRPYARAHHPNINVHQCRASQASSSRGSLCREQCQSNRCCCWLMSYRECSLSYLNTSRFQKVIDCAMMRPWMVTFFFVSFICWTHACLTAPEKGSVRYGGWVPYFLLCAFHLCNSRLTGACPPPTHQPWAIVGYVRSSGTHDFSDFWKHIRRHYTRHVATCRRLYRWCRAVRHSLKDTYMSKCATYSNIFY